MSLICSLINCIVISDLVMVSPAKLVCFCAYWSFTGFSTTPFYPSTLHNLSNATKDHYILKNVINIFILPRYSNYNFIQHVCVCVTTDQQVLLLIHFVEVPPSWSKECCKMQIFRSKGHIIKTLSNGQTSVKLFCVFAGISCN